MFSLILKFGNNLNDLKLLTCICMIMGIAPLPHDWVNEIIACWNWSTGVPNKVIRDYVSVLFAWDEGAFSYSSVEVKNKLFTRNCQSSLLLMCWPVGFAGEQS